MVEHAWNRLEGYDWFIIRWGQVFNLSHYLHSGYLLKFTLREHLLENVPGLVIVNQVSVFLGTLQESACIATVDRHLVSATDQVLPVFEHMDQRLDSYAIISHLSSGEVKLFNVED